MKNALHLAALASVCAAGWLLIAAAGWALWTAARLIGATW